MRMEYNAKPKKVSDKPDTPYWDEADDAGGPYEAQNMEYRRPKGKPVKRKAVKHKKPKRVKRKAVKHKKPKRVKRKAVKHKKKTKRKKR